LVAKSSPAGGTGTRAKQGRHLNRSLKIFAGSSHPTLARAIAKHAKVTLGQRRITRFSNENIKVKIDENVRGSDVFVIQTSAAPLSDHIVELLILIDALKFASAARITAVLPYFPYARSDKKDEARISITARLMADLLETAGADRVLTMTLHAPQILGFFRRPADQLLATPILKRHFKRSALSDTVVVATDAGAGKIAGHFAKRLGLPMAVIDKRRFDDSEKALSTALIGDVRGRDTIIYDDEIATGGSIQEAARILRHFGARRLRVGVTHAVLSGPALEKLRAAALDELVVTDTVPVSPDKIKGLPGLKVLSTAKLFADAILRIHQGRSVSAIVEA
jgi:ribose-phosphate pyrophosphokinase